MKVYPIATIGLVVAAGLVLDTAGGPRAAAFGGEACRQAAAAEAAGPRTIDLAICLDTSGSMRGLIDSARQKLWAIVNDLATAEPAPRLRVALLTFGNDGHNAENGWVRVDSGLTEDLDRISQQLFAQTTNGGTEYVGRALQYAGRLDWHPSEEALKLVVVAGNESADQDAETPFRDECRALIGRGIMINSIYCGPATDDLAPAWREVATLADGRFASIDQDHGTVVVETPFDDQLTALSSALNETYVPFGATGEQGRVNQAEQDRNAFSLNKAASASRARTKAQGLYHCAWDLVDACGRDEIKLADVETADLPEVMRPMSLEQRQAFVDEMAGKRAGIQARINEVSRQREAYVTEQMKARSLDDADAFDVALRRAIRDQARSRGFRFKEAAPTADPDGKEQPS